MSPARAFRLAAIAIVVVATIDPVWPRAGALPQPMAVVMIAPVSDPARASGVAEHVRSALSDDHAVSVHHHEPGRDASACPAEGGCIVISSGAVPSRWTAGAELIGAIYVPDTAPPAVVRRTTSPGRVSVNGLGWLEVEVGARRATTVAVEVRDAGVLVGREPDVALASAGEVRTVRVAWTPLAVGARRLQVNLATEPGSHAASPTDVGVEVIAERSPVVMYEPEMTWLGTFVRRVIDADPRFRLDARTRLAPGVAAGAPGGLTRAALAAAGVVIVTAPDALSASEVDLLDRFVSSRGGSLVVLPVRRPTGPVTRILPPIVAEHLRAEPRAAGPLRASEFLTFDGTAPGVTVLTSVDEGPLVVAAARGRGQIVASGALDAWRFRGDAGFNRFFASVVEGAVRAAGETLEVALDPLAAPGARAALTVEWRAIDDLPSAITAGADVTCDDGYAAPVRLWPGGRRGVFTGSVQVPHPTTCTVEARIGEPGGLARARALLVAPALQHPMGDPQALARGVAAHGGVLVDGDDLSALAARTRARRSAPRTVHDTRPMRSPWWILPLTACLGAEWWLRRRAGQR